MPGATIRLSLRFTGRVQGVGFRYTASDCARARPVTGWVRNEPDGSVAMQIQGQPAHVEHVLDDLAARMRGNIENAERNPIEVVEGETGFGIRR